MKTAAGIILLAFILGVFSWMSEGLADYYTFHHGQGSIWDPLIFTSSNELYTRLAVLIIFVGYGVVVSVISARRKKAEEELSERVDFTQRVFNSTNDHLAVVDADGTIVEVNQAWRRFAEVNSGDEAHCNVGASYFQQYSEEWGDTSFASAAYDGLRQVQQGKLSHFDIEYPCNSPTEERWFLMRVQPLVGRVGTVLVYHANITERKRVAERDRHIAEVLQQTLAPSHRPMQLAGFEIAARYQPALREAEVGGDFYDLFDIGDGKIGITIGDMVGKGLHAAAHIAAVRQTVRNYAFVDALPSHVMTLVNGSLFKEIEDENDMLTAFFAILNTLTGRLTYTNAGHEPPLIWHSDGNVEYLTAGGPMFSSLERSVYLESSLEFQADDILVLVTDGITESRKVGQSELFGTEGIVGCLSKTARGSAECIASCLLEDAISFAEGCLQDDVALVVIKKLKDSD